MSVSAGFPWRCAFRVKETLLSFFNCEPTVHGCRTDHAYIFESAAADPAIPLSIRPGVMDDVPF